ncbi:VWA domain-containing protein [Candidatus Woesearchaeota archaeon]|nr:VWA domain-containing protein [Candidatus Woesearchaeota archaeon]
MPPDADVRLVEGTSIDEMQGKLRFTSVDNKLMHAVLENDRKVIDEGKLIRESISNNIGAFTPDLMFEQIVKNYSLTKQLFGDSLLRRLTGYDARYIEKNLHIPEFRRELRSRLAETIEHMKDEGFVESSGEVTQKGLELASLVLYTEELDHLAPKGAFGEKLHKKFSVYGDKAEDKRFRKGDTYRNLALRKSLKMAIRRSHAELLREDLKTFERQSKGQIYIIYALDASGSMRGRKIDTCKKAGVALAFNALRKQDKVGLIVFGSDIKTSIPPTDNFTQLLKEITRIKAAKETNIAKTIQRATELFPATDATRHLILLTDALPTTGEDPQQETIEMVSLARSMGITVSLIGIQLDEKGKKLAEKIVELGQGRLYVVRDLENLDKIVLEDYYAL